MADINIVYIWLLSGVALVALEVLGASGVGLLFAGLGALTVGAAIDSQLLLPASYISQFVLFFATSALWTVMLWLPMKNHGSKTRQHFSNIVGETAYAGGSGISKKKGGEATWSGTIMHAQLISDAAVDSVDAGTEVTIVALKGATLIVKPKE